VRLPGWCGVPGARHSGRLTGFGIAQLVSTGWPIAILRCASLGAGPAQLPAMAGTGRPDCSFQLSRHEHEHWVVGQSDHEPSGTAHGEWVIIFRGVSAPAHLFLVVAVGLWPQGSGASAAVARRFRVTSAT
jgi:hypothetical protein